MLSKLLNWKVVGIGYLLLGIAVGYYYFQHQIAEQTIEARDRSIVELKSEVQGLNDDLETLQNDIEYEVKKNQELRQVNSEIRQRYQVTEDKLIRAMGRQELVWKKPELVERFFRKNWNEFTSKASCVAGVIEECEK